MSKAPLYILQHIYTLEYVTKTKGGKGAYTFTTNQREATHFTNEQAVSIIGATADVTEASVQEMLKAIEV